MNTKTSALTMADVAEYIVAFKGKYERDTTLTLDAMEAIIMNAEADMTADDIAEAMFEAEGNDEKPAEKQDDSDSDLPESSSAFEFADKMDDELAMLLENNAAAALENKRGAAVIARKLIAMHTLETIVNVWPEPGTEGENGTKFKGNRLADYYKTIVHKDDGSSSPGERSWYRDYLERSKAAAVPMMELKSIKAVSRNEQAPYILAEHEAIRGDKIKIKSKRAAIDSNLSNKKNALTRSVNLIQKMQAFNTRTEFGCEIMLEQAMNEQGKPVFEKDGKTAVMVPVKSNKCIEVFNRKNERQNNVLSIGQLLALKFVEGGTYQTITGTTTRKPKGGGAPAATENVKVETPKAFDDVMAATAQFEDKIMTQFRANDLKEYNALLTHLNSDGSDDLLLSMNKVMGFLEGLLSKPGIATRLNKLLTDGKAKTAA